MRERHASERHILTMPMLLLATLALLGSFAYDSQPDQLITGQQFTHLKICTDKDGDTFNGGLGGTVAKCGILDCNDNDATVYPGATEVCNDGKDNSCNGFADCEDPVCFTDSSCSGNSQGDIFITINDPFKYRHPSGSGFSITVTASDPGIFANVLGQWVDAEGNALSNEIPFPFGKATTFTSPGSKDGYYGLRFTSENPNIAFPPQEHGFGSAEYGFSILDILDVADRQLDLDSPYGTVHTNEFDGNLHGFMKSLTWNTKSDPDDLAMRMKELEDVYKLTELLIINGEDWDVDDTKQITQQELDNFGDRLGSYFDAFITHNVVPIAIQYGIEENGGGKWPQEQYTEYNLRKKMERATQEMQDRGLSYPRAFSMRGFDYEEFDNFAQSQAGDYFDILGMHPYKWTDFPDPEDWLQDHINKIYDSMVTYGGPTRIWHTEIGLPHRGNNNPDGFFGYPDSGNEVPGATLEHAARYIVKAHAEALTSGHIEKLFWYNYYDRGNEHDYAEHHFGARRYDGSKNKNGPTKPMYLSYVTMLGFLKDKDLINSHNPQNDIYVYDFTNNAQTESVLLAWIFPESQRSIPLDSLRSGLTSQDVVAVEDMYGTPLSLNGENVILNGRPLFVQIVG